MPSTLWSWTETHEGGAPLGNFVVSFLIFVGFLGCLDGFLEVFPQWLRTARQARLRPPAGSGSRGVQWN